MNISADSVYGYLFEVGFYEQAADRFRFDLLPVQQKKELCLSYLESVGENLEFAEKVVETGRAAYKTYERFFLNSLRSSLKGKAKPAKFVDRVLEEETSEPLNWQNADFIARWEVQGKNVWQFLELTTSGGGLTVLKYLYAGGEGNVNDALSLLAPSGISPTVNYLNRSLEDFALELATELTSLSKASVPIEATESFKTAQVIGYILSFILAGRNVEVGDLFWFGLIFPHRPAPYGLFRYNGRLDRVARALELLRAFYGEVKHNVGRSTPFGLIREKRLEFSSELGRIGVVREEVAEQVFNAREREVNFLVHPAGAGKSTSTRRFVFHLNSQGERVLYLYFSPRKKIVAENYEKFVRDGGVGLIPERSFSTKGDKFAGYARKGYETGKLRSLLSVFPVKVKQAIREGKPLGVFSTLQSIARVGNYSTASVLAKMASIWWENGGTAVVAVLDEITGSRGGVQALRDLCCALDEGDINNLKQFIFALDANYLCGSVVEKHLNWVQEFELSSLPAPEFLVKVSEEEFRETLHYRFHSGYLGRSAVVHGRPAFIGSSLTLTLRREIVTASSAKKARRKVVDRLVKELLKLPGTFLYIQDTEIAEKIAAELGNRGKKAFVLTSLVGDVSSSLDKYDYVIGTASLSRGVDIGFNRAIIVVPSFGLESQLAEVYQAVSRLRKGIPNEGHKEITLLALWWGREPDSTARSLIEFRLHKILWLAKEVVLSYALKEKDVRFVVLPPAKAHTGDSSFLSLLRQLEKASKVNISTNIKGGGAIAEKIMECYPYSVYRVAGRFELSPELIRLVLSRIRENGDLRPQQKREFIDVLNNLLREGGRIAFEHFYAVKHDVISAAFEPPALYETPSRAGTEDSIFKTVVKSLTGFVFPLSSEPSACYGSVPKIPVEMLT